MHSVHCTRISRHNPPCNDPAKCRQQPAHGLFNFCPFTRPAHHKRPCNSRARCRQVERGTEEDARFTLTAAIPNVGRRRRKDTGDRIADLSELPPQRKARKPVGKQGMSVQCFWGSGHTTKCPVLKIEVIIWAVLPGPSVRPWDIKHRFKTHILDHNQHKHGNQAKNDRCGRDLIRLPHSLEAWVLPHTLEAWGLPHSLGAWGLPQSLEAWGLPRSL